MTIQAASLTALTPDEAATTASSILDAGYEGLILENPVHQDAWRALLSLLPKESVKAMRLFLPCRRRPRPGSTSLYEVATENPGDREETLREARKTLDAADQVGPPIVVVEGVVSVRNQAALRIPKLFAFEEPPNIGRLTLPTPFGLGLPPRLEHRHFFTAAAGRGRTA